MNKENKMNYTEQHEQSELNGNLRDSQMGPGIRCCYHRMRFTGVLDMRSSVIYLGPGLKRPDCCFFTTLTLKDQIMSNPYAPKLLYVSIFQEFSGPKETVEVFLSHVRCEDDPGTWESNKAQITFSEFSRLEDGIQVLSNVLGKLGATLLRD